MYKNYNLCQEGGKTLIKEAFPANILPNKHLSALVFLEAETEFKLRPRLWSKFLEANSYDLSVRITESHGV